MNKSNVNNNPSLFENLEWLSVEQASRLFPMSKSMLYKHKQYGIPARKLGKKLMFKKSEIEEWLERWAA